MASATSGCSARSSFATTPTPEDPYVYQTGFGNRFATEALLVVFNEDILPMSADLTIDLAHFQLLEIPRRNVNTISTQNK